MSSDGEDAALARLCSSNASSWLRVVLMPYAVQMSLERSMMEGMQVEKRERMVVYVFGFLRASSMYDREVTRGRRENSGDGVCAVVGGCKTNNLGRRCKREPSCMHPSCCVAMLSSGLRGIARYGVREFAARPLEGQMFARQMSACQ